MSPINLRTYLDGLPRGGIAELASELGISNIYLLQLAARQDGRKPSPELCVQIEKATHGAVTRKELRPDDWRAIWPELAASNESKKPRH
jgi:DNA-binding transcriptional regulator YdaS (Cro superfamily)